MGRIAAEKIVYNLRFRGILSIMKFTPIEKQDVHIAEVDVDEVLSKIKGKPFEDNFVEFAINGRDYTINLSSPRYHVLAANRTCVCCGIIGNKMFLDKQTDPKFEEELHFNLYATSRDIHTNRHHATLMTRDHIVERKDGGSDEYKNFQTLCYNCNMMKSYGLTIEQIQSSLFCAYRAFRASYPLRKTQDLLVRYNHIYKKHFNTATRLQEAFDAGLIVNNKKVQIAKLARCRKIADDLGAKIRKVELKAQSDGFIPSEEAVELGIGPIDEYLR